MKKLLFAFFFSLPMISFSQSSKQKVIRDSISYYQKQLAELRKATYDSMLNSEKYKELINKLNQTEKQNASNFGVELIFFTGIQKNDYSNLNTRLTSLSVEKKELLMLPVGIGLAFRFNKVIVGYDMTPIMIGDNSTGSYIHGYLSTNVIRTERWIISPQFGYGGETVRMRVTTRSSSSDFNSYFTTPANQVEIKHSNSVLDFGVAFKLSPKNDNANIPLFRIGYRYGLKDKIWEVSDGTSINAPYDRNSNFYLQVIFGFGD